MIFCLNPIAQPPRARPSVLIFVASDCPICNAYSPEISRIYNRFKEKVRFELVFSEPAISTAGAKRHAAQFGLGGLDIAIDPNGKLARHYQVNVTPESAVLDPSGNEAYRGRIDDRYVKFGSQRSSVRSHDLIRAIESVLAHKRVAPASGPSIGCTIEAAYPPISQK